MSTRIQQQQRHLPAVAIVGRPNVGKSAIFNRLAGRRIAIVHDQPGVTRDRIAADCTQGPKPFSVVDTGGIGASLDDGFAEAVHTEADIAIETAEIILFVVDGPEGSTTIDDALADRLRKSDRPVILVVNKIDEATHEPLAAEFAKYGFGESLCVSAAHGRGFDALRAALDAHLPDMGNGGSEGKRTPKRPIQIALVGRPNVGKSSLVNSLLDDQRTIVSEVAGTTRDAVDVPFSHGGIDYVFIDTAGIRPRKKRDSSVEVFSVMRSERSIRRADLCALVIDAAAGVRSQDRKIASLILDANKPCVVVLNKFDLYHPDGPKRDRLELLKDEVCRELFFLHYAPMVAASALKNQYVTRVFKCVEDIRKAARQGLNTGTLNRLLHLAMERNPPPSIKAKKHKRLKLLYATMAPRAEDERPVPVPDILMFVNQADLLQDNYQRYLEARIREESPYTGIPLKFQLRERKKRKQRP